MLRGIVRTLRPHQWVKNLFVLAPLVFGRQLMAPVAQRHAAIAVVVFCLLSGAVYAFNDVRDREADRQHPQKCQRPIASGVISVQLALTLSAGLAAMGLGAAYWVNPWLALVAAGYLANNLLYTLWLKHVAYIDVGSIAAGFVLRVVAGAVAIAVPASTWLLLCTAELALFLGLGKRAHELAAVEGSATRQALRGYRVEIVRTAMLILAGATSATYIAYTQALHTVQFFGTSKLIFTAPFAVLGIARFLDLALWHRRADSPTEAMLRDWLFIANLAAWGVVTMLIVY